MIDDCAYINNIHTNSCNTMFMVVSHPLWQPRIFLLFLRGTESPNFYGAQRRPSLPLSSSKRPQPGLSVSTFRKSRVGESRLSTPLSPNTDTRDVIRVWLPPHQRLLHITVGQAKHQHQSQLATSRVGVLSPRSPPLRIPDTRQVNVTWTLPK